MYVVADLPPSLELRRTAVALAEAGQVGPAADLKVRGYTQLKTALNSEAPHGDSH